MPPREQDAPKHTTQHRPQEKEGESLGKSTTYQPIMVQLMEENKQLKEQVNKHEQLLDALIENIKNQPSSNEIRIQALSELVQAEKHQKGLGSLPHHPTLVGHPQHAIPDS